MRPPNGTNIPVISAGKQFKSLVNDDIMHQKIPETIGHDTKPDCLHPPDIIVGPKIDQQDAGQCKDDEEGIILFKKTRLNLVVIFMQAPKKSMHDVTVRKPGNSFHNYESGRKNKYVKKPIHVAEIF
jgi:hypothetical protein